MKKKKNYGRYSFKIRVICIILAALTVIGAASILIYMMIL